MSTGPATFLQLSACMAFPSAPGDIDLSTGFARMVPPNIIAQCLIRLSPCTYFNFMTKIIPPKLTESTLHLDVWQPATSGRRIDWR
jgi:hypothetical protein